MNSTHIEFPHLGWEIDLLHRRAVVALLCATGACSMFLPSPNIQPRCAANDITGGPAAIPEVSLTALVDLLAEAYVGKLETSGNQAGVDGITVIPSA
jgi:hypothetical protein